MTRCSACGVELGIDRGTHVGCPHCGAWGSHEADAPPPAEVLPPAPLPSTVDGGVMLSASERAEYRAMFGREALDELLSRSGD